MIHKHCENTYLQKEMKVPYCQVEREQLSVKTAVLLLIWAEPPTEKS